MVTPERAKELLAVHGEVRPQSPSDWRGTFSLPDSAVRFYREVGPFDITIEGYGNPYLLPRLGRLWDFQAGYRWNGLTGQPVPEWDDDWLVVANEAGDPFILSRSSGRVLHAYHGEGEWDPEEMFPDLNAMAACLAELGAVVLDSGLDLTDETYSLRPEFRSLASSRLRYLLGTLRAAESVLGALGWG